MLKKGLIRRFALCCMVCVQHNERCTFFLKRRRPALQAAGILIQAAGSSGGSGPVMLLALRTHRAGRDAVLHQ